MDRELIRIEGSLVYIKQPSFEELEYVNELWNDEDTMADVGGVHPFPLEKRGEWYKRMVSPSDGKNCYFLIFNREGNPVGEVSFHRYDDRYGSAELNIKVQKKFRGRGYSKEAVRLILEYFFYEFGGKLMKDEVININGQEALRKFGFKITSEENKSVIFTLTKEEFELIKERLM